MIGRRPIAWLSALLLAVQASAATADGLAASFDAARKQTVIGADGVPLTVVDQGDPASPAVVFIHGYRQSHLSWFAQFGSTLSQHCHLVAYDLRGHGDSGSPWQAEAYARPEVWADDLARVMAATGARRPLIVAWSFGGLVAMDYLRQARSDARSNSDPRLAGLVLVGTTGQLLPDLPRPTTMPPPQDLATRAAGAQATTDLVYGATMDPQRRASFAAVSLRAGPYLDAAIADRAKTLNNADLLPKLRALPVTLVNGGHDAIVPPAWIAQLKTLLPEARGVDFADSGHAPFADAPERFDALLKELHCHR